MLLQKAPKALCIILMGASLIVASQSAQAKKKARNYDPQTLVQLWLQENYKCRGGLPDDPRTDVACEVREAYGKRLEAQGWCYGEPGQMGSQMVWHQCTDGQAALLAAPDAPIVLACSGKTMVFGEYGVLKSSRTWDNEILVIDQRKFTVRHNDEPTGPTLTAVTDTHYSWHQDSTLITDGSFNRISGTGEERMTMHFPGFLAKNFYENCRVAPAPRF